MGERSRIWLALATALVLAFSAQTSGSGVAIASVRTAAADAIRVPTDVCFWQTVDWDDMNTAEQAAWESLGWTPDTWESDDPQDYPPSEFKAWAQLTAAERKTLTSLGYTEKTWDNIEAVCAQPA